MIYCDKMIPRKNNLRFWWCIICKKWTTFNLFKKLGSIEKNYAIQFNKYYIMLKKNTKEKNNYLII